MVVFHHLRGEGSVQTCGSIFTSIRKKRRKAIVVFCHFERIGRLLLFSIVLRYFERAFELSLFDIVLRHVGRRR